MFVILNIFLPFLRVFADIPCRNLYSKRSFVRVFRYLKIRRRIIQEISKPSASPMPLISVRSLRNQMGFHRSNTEESLSVILFHHRQGRLRHPTRNNIRMFIDFRIQWQRTKWLSCLQEIHSLYGQWPFGGNNGSNVNSAG